MGLSSIPGRRTSPFVTNAHGKARFPKHTASASPLRTELSQLSPSSCQPSLSAKGSTVSRTSSLPSTPLDDIPEKLWPRVLRSATTPETSNPDLSIEEITSTRLSLDDQAILTSLPRSVDQKRGGPQSAVTRTRIASIWGDNGGRLKKMTKRLKRLPNGIFTRKDRTTLDLSNGPQGRPKTPSPMLPQTHVAAQPCPLATPLAVTDQPHSDRLNKPMLLVCTPR